MLRWLDWLLKIAMGVSLGVFIGKTVWMIWDFRVNTEIYEVMSAPWYTSVLVSAVFTVVFLAVCGGARFALRRFRR